MEQEEIHLDDWKRILLQNTEKRPGLSIFSTDDKNINIDKKKEGVFACAHCGNISNTRDDCSNCGRKEWVAATE